MKDNSNNNEIIKYNNDNNYKYFVDYYLRKSSLTSEKNLNYSSSNYKLSNFQKIAQVGEGTYGVVYKVKKKNINYKFLNNNCLNNSSISNNNFNKEISKNEQNNIEFKQPEYFALKKLIYEDEKDGFPITALREIQILKEINHSNIVKLLDVLASKPCINNIKGNFYLLLEYIEHDLSGLLEKKIKFTNENIKIIMYQILKGIEYMHNTKSILHRDIKASNILITSEGIVKIADFGLARHFNKIDCKNRKYYTNKVITLWYRPPELFFGETIYNESVDIWSIGILFWQLMIGYAPMRATTDIEQIEKILQILGSVDEDDWPEVKSLKKYNNITKDLPKSKGVFSDLTKE